MKIYTFNAPDTTRVEILSPLKPKNKDRIFDKFIEENDYTEVASLLNCDLAIYPRRVFQPETLEFDSGVYEAVVAAQQYGKPIIIDATSDSDVFLNLPTAHILRCGLYKSLQQTFETECPFWSNYRTKNILDFMTVNQNKGNKPVVGFCGTTSSRGRLSNLVKSSVPKNLTQFALSQGKIARQIDIRVKEGMSLKLRQATIDLLVKDPRIETYFDITNNHQSYYSQSEQNRILLEKLFIKNMQRCDYTLCVRGTGNYSGRFYMALNAGRIPIVLDTDVVIPYEDLLYIIKVPIQDFHRIGDIILEHFESVTELELKYIKLQNKEVFNQFLTPEKFFANYIKDCLES